MSNKNYDSITSFSALDYHNNGRILKKNLNKGFSKLYPSNSELVANIISNIFSNE